MSTEWLTTLVGSFLGAVLGIPAGLFLEHWRARRQQRQQTLAMLRVVVASLRENNTKLAGIVSTCSQVGQVQWIAPSCLDVSWWHGALLSRIELIGEPKLLQELFAVFVCTDHLNQLIGSLVQVYTPLSQAVQGWEERAKLLAAAVASRARQCQQLTESALGTLRGLVGGVES